MAVAVNIAVAVGRVVRIRAWGRAVLVLFRGRHGDFDLYCSRREEKGRKEFKIVVMIMLGKSWSKGGRN